MRSAAASALKVFFSFSLRTGPRPLRAGAQGTARCTPRVGRLGPKPHKKFYGGRRRTQPGRTGNLPPPHPLLRCPIRTLTPTPPTGTRRGRVSALEPHKARGGGSVPPAPRQLRRGRSRWVAMCRRHGKREWRMTSRDGRARRSPLLLQLLLPMLLLPFLLLLALLLLLLLLRPLPFPLRPLL